MAWVYGLSLMQGLQVFEFGGLGLSIKERGRWVLEGHSATWQA